MTQLNLRSIADLSRSLFTALLAVALSLFISTASDAQPTAGDPSRALEWNAPATTIAGWTPTMFVVGDPKLVASALRGLSRIIHPSNNSASALLPTIKIGLLISLMFACVAWFSKGKIAWTGWAGMVFLSYIMFIQSTTVIVQSYFTYSGSVMSANQLSSTGEMMGGGGGSAPGGISTVGGAGRFELVDRVPLGFAIPIAISGAISVSLADLFMSSYQTIGSATSETGTLQFADPLRQLLALRSTNVCVSSQLCRSIFDWTRYCTVGTAPNATTGASETFTIDISKLDRDPDALKNLLSGANSPAGWSAGSTVYYPLAPANGALMSEGVPKSCADAGPLILADISTQVNGTTSLVGAGGNTPRPGSTETTTGFVTPTSTVHPAVSALQTMTGMAGVNANAVVEQLAAWKVVEAGIASTSKPLDAAQFTALTMISDATEKWRVDGAAEGSVFLRGIFASMNVLLFVLICMTPLVFLLAVTMLGDGIKIIKEYLITIVWTQSWFPAAVVVNYYITEMLATKISSYNLANPLAIFAPINHVAFYEEVGTALSSAGWMIGSIPVLTYALLRGSTQGIVSLASKAAGGGGAGYANEATAAPDLATATNAKATTKAATDIGGAPQYFAGAGSTPGEAQTGQGIMVGASGGTTAATALSRSSAQKAEAAAQRQEQATSAYATQLQQATSQGQGVNHKDSSGRSLTFGEGTSFTSTDGSRTTLSNAGAAVLSESLRGGLTGATVGAAIAAASVGAAAAAAMPASSTGAQRAAASAKAMGAKVAEVAEGARAAAGGGAKGALAAGAVMAIATLAGGVLASSAASIEGRKTATETLTSESSNGLAWARDSKNSKGGNFNTGSESVTGTDAKASQSLNNSAATSDSATTSSSTANTNATTASKTAQSTNGVSANTSLGSGEVKNAVTNAGMGGVSLTNISDAAVARMVASGAMSSDEGDAAKSKIAAATTAAAHLQHPSFRSNPTGAGHAAVDGLAAVASSPNSTPQEKMAAGAAFGNVASAAGGTIGNGNLVTAGDHIAQAYGATATSAKAADEAGAKAVNAVGPSGAPNTPSSASPVAGGAALTSAVAARQGAMAGLVATNTATVSGEAGALKSAVNNSGVNNDTPLAQVGPPQTAPTQTVPKDGMAAKMPTGGSDPKLQGTEAPQDLTSLESSPTADLAKRFQAGSPLPTGFADLAKTASIKTGLPLDVTEALVRSRMGDNAALNASLTNARANLAALSAANIKGIDDTSKLSPRAQGELAVLADRIGIADATAILSGRVTEAQGLAGLARMTGDSDTTPGSAIANGIAASGSAAAAYSKYAARFAAAKANNIAMPSDVVRSPTAMEKRVVGALDRNISADNLGILAIFGPGALLLNIAIGEGANAIKNAPSPKAQTQPRPVPQSTFITTAADGALSLAPTAIPATTATGKPEAAAKKQPPPSAAIIALVEQAARRTGGLGASAFTGLIAAESSGNASAKNENSTATGLGQFIESTWKGLATTPGTYLNAKAQADGMLFKMGGRLTVRPDKEEQLLALRSDPRTAVESVADLTNENLTRLIAADLPGIGDMSTLSDQEKAAYAYMMHLAGDDGLTLIKYGAGGAKGLSDERGEYLLKQQLGPKRADALAQRIAAAGGSAAIAFKTFAEQRALKVANAA